MKAHGQFTDWQLLDRLKSADTTAFRELYDRYWQRLLYFASQKVKGDMAEAENIVQDVFVSLWDRRERLCITSSFEAYLVTSVKYRVIKWLNRQCTESLYNKEGLAIDISDDSTLQYLAFDELQERLGKLIGTLPEKARLIYRLNQEEGMSHQQIADELGMTVTAVNVTLVRIRKTLRTSLGSLLTSFLL